MDTTTAEDRLAEGRAAGLAYGRARSRAKLVLGLVRRKFGKDTMDDVWPMVFPYDQDALDAAEVADAVYASSSGSQFVAWVEGAYLEPSEELIASVNNAPTLEAWSREDLRHVKAEQVGDGILDGSAIGWSEGATDLLVELAARKFGADTAEQLSALIDPGNGLGPEILDAIYSIGGSAEFLARVRGKSFERELLEAVSRVDQRKLNRRLAAVMRDGMADGVRCGMAKGNAMGRIEGRIDLLADLAARKFGPEAADRLVDAIGADTAKLGPEVAEAIHASDSEAELLARVKRL